MANLQTYRVTEPYLNLNCGLGEAPFWEKSRNSLRFVDIVKKKLFIIDLSKGPSSLRQIDLAESIACTADIEGNDDEFIFGGKKGYGVMNRETGETRYIQTMWNDSERVDDNGGKPGVGSNREYRMRSNDGAVDPLGRYWVDDDAVVGSNFTDEGILFRLDSDLSLDRALERVTIPNGTSWSPDNKTMYFTDSPSRTIKSYPFDPETGDVSFSEGQTFFTLEAGVPDGHCQDEEGHLWVAGHSTGKVFRVNPQGEVVAVVELPTRCVTCPALCGTELFITSMAEQDPETYPESVKYQGAVFKVDVGVRGKPLHKFKMNAKA